MKNKFIFKQRDKVVVIRIDRKGIRHAKQLYYSLYKTAGWTGDFLILSHEIPTKDLIWFTDKGAYVKKCKPLFKVGIWFTMTTSKLYIFTNYIKRWRHVIYLDTDVIITASIDKLAEVKGYAAAPEIDEQPLYHQLRLENLNDWKILQRVEHILGKKYNIYQKSFNTGVFAFNTDIIKKDTFSKIMTILRVAAPISNFGEQTIENLYFYNNWERLPRIYNLVPQIYITNYKIDKKNLKAIIFHFAGIESPACKPWHKENIFYREWIANFKLSKSYNFSTPGNTGMKWSKLLTWTYEKYLYSWRFAHSNLSQIYSNLSDVKSFCIIEFKQNLKSKFKQFYNFYKLF